MEDGNVNQFLEEITWQEEFLLFRGKRYFFNPCGYGDHAALAILQLNQKNEWEADVFYIEGKDTRECVQKMINAPIWEGMTFWEAESEMRWIE